MSIAQLQTDEGILSPVSSGSPANQYLTLRRVTSCCLLFLIRPGNWNIHKMFFPPSPHPTRTSPRSTVFFAEILAIKYAVCQRGSEVVNFDWILCYITTWHLTWKMTFCFTCQQSGSHQISEWEKFSNFNFLMLLDTTSSILKQFSSACTCFGIHAVRHTTCYYNSFFCLKGKEMRGSLSWG